MVGDETGVGHDFESLYRTHVGQIYGLCLRMTGQRALAEDCTQDCFIAAWRALASFEGRSELATWLHRIAVNCVLAQRRWRQGNPIREASALEDEALDVPGCTDTAGTLDVEDALGRLPQGARSSKRFPGI